MEKSIFLKFQVVYLQLQKYLISCIKNTNDENKKQELRELIDEVGQTYLKVKQKFEEQESKVEIIKEEPKIVFSSSQNINENYEILEAELEPIKEGELF